MTTAELNLASNYIQALASMPDATERIGLFISSLLAQSKGSDFESDKCVSCDITFTKKEIKQMPEYFRRKLLIQGLQVSCRKRVRGKNLSLYTYELRYRKDGYKYYCQEYCKYRKS